MDASATRGHAEDTVHPDDPELNHEQSPLLGSEQIHSPLSEEQEDKDHARQVASWKRLPWWRRPSPYWLIFGTFFSSIGFAALLAPKLAMYTALACRVHRPKYDLPRSTYTSSSDYIQNGLDSQQKCASDPVVQAVVARLNAVFTTSVGIVSCLTTGWWGSLSDRYGRRIVLFVSVLGFFVAEFTHIITAWFVDVLPGGYWFPWVGFLIEGLCGGTSSKMAITQVYLADTTDPSTRSRYFSLSLGLMFVGVAVGPALGGLLIRSTGTILSVFYLACVLDGLYAIFVLLVLPESLTHARARGARLRRGQEKANQPSGRVLNVLESITKFLRPVAVLLPEQSLDANPPKQRTRDWSLFLIAIAFGLLASVTGSYPYKLQYGAAQFNWTPEITSYYVSFLGATRACFLAVVLPLIIKYFKATPVQLPSTPHEPLRDAVGISASRGASSLPQTNASGQRLPASGSPAFDLAVARASAGLEIASFLGLMVASTGTLYALADTIGSFAVGFPPAMQALALHIYTDRRSQNKGEIGKLFGALSVIQALGSQIISPALYGFVYLKTVAGFPQAIMIVSMCTSLLALIFLSFVCLPSKLAVALGHGNEQGTQHTATPEI